MMRLLKGIFRLGLWLSAGGLLAVAAGALVIVVFVIPQLPSTGVLKDVRFQVPLRVYSRDGKLMSEFGEKRRIPLRLDQVPDLMVKALLASEDEHFYAHPGVDWRGLARAVLYLIRTGRKGPGGSTITMQVARNFFLGREKTYLRKLNEILLSLRIERELTKDEILDLYLNKIFLGNRAYGVGAAAEVYYGKPVGELDLAQMAMIAGLPQRPSAYNPIVNPKQALARRDYVLGRMAEAGYIDDATRRAAVAEPLTATLHSPIVELNAPYVAEMVRAYVEHWAGESAYTDGYNVYTTIDSHLQSAATEAVRKGLVAYDRRHGYRGPELKVELKKDGTKEDWEGLLKDLPPIGGLRAALVLEVTDTDAKVYVRGHGEVILPWASIQWARKYVDENHRGPALKSAREVLSPGDVIRVALAEDEWELAQVPKVEGALVALDPDDGGIVALVGGFDYFRSKFNRITQAERQPGSNFKPFVYSAALQKGLTAATLINDAPVVFDDPALEAAWRPENYSGKFFGPTRLRLALTKSRNLVSIRLLRRVGIDFTLQHLARFGLDTEHLPRNLSLALGSGALSPLELANGYAILANGGYGVRSYFVSRIEDSRGKTVFRADPAVVCATCEASGGTGGQGVENAPAAPAAADAAQSPAPPPGSAAPVHVAPRTVDAQNVWIIDSILRDVIKHGTGRRALSLHRGDIAGKTGTTNDQQDAWFSGFVPSLTATAWVGFDQIAPLGRGETGARAALPVWMDFMSHALAGVPEEIPERPDGLVTVRIDPDTGELADASQPNAIFETFRAGRVPVAKSPLHPPPMPDDGETPVSASEAPRSTRAEGTTKSLF